MGIKDNDKSPFTDGFWFDAYTENGKYGVMWVRGDGVYTPISEVPYYCGYFTLYENGCPHRALLTASLNSTARKSIKEFPSQEDAAFFAADLNEQQGIWDTNKAEGYRAAHRYEEGT